MINASSQQHERPVLGMVRFAPWMHFEGGHPHDLLWPVSMLYASSLARRQGWQPRIIDLHVESLSLAETVQRVCGWAPKLVLIDTMTPTVPLALKLARKLREKLPCVPIWAVGQHASTIPEEFMSEEGLFSGCVHGEYEAGLPALLDAAGRQEAW